MRLKSLLVIFFVLVSFCGYSQTIPAAEDSSVGKRIIICGWPIGDQPQLNGPLGHLEYLKQHIKYPADEKQREIQGTVYIRFIVKADGSLDSIKEARGVPDGPGFTTEAIRVISGMPKWKPAEDQDGNPVDYPMIIPVRFVLENSTTTDTAVYSYAEVMPEFPGGRDSLNKFWTKNIKYCIGTCSAGCKEGTVYMSFIVEKDGSITNIKPLKEVNSAPEFTKEAIRVISIMPKWTPGKINDQVVRVEVKQPVRFRL